MTTAAPAAVLAASDTVVSGALPLAVAVAALAGLVSFASPCVLPLVPGFLGYVSGLTGDAAQRRGRTMLGALLFVAGFTAVFVIGAAFASGLGRVLVLHQQALMRVGGILITLMGLVFLGAGARWGIQREAKVHWRPRAGLLGAPLLGAVFGLGWAPCTGPTLGAVMVMATASDDAWVARGVGLAVAYGLGLGLPFLFVAAGLDRAGRVSAWLRRHQRAIQLSGGVLLVVVGLLFVTGVWQDLNTWIQAELVSGFEVAL